MDDVLGYEGKHVVVTGAASGMGEQVARILHELGANVTALDVKPVSTPVKTSLTLDLLDQASIDGVVGEIDGPVDSVFSCAGLPGPPFTDLQTAIVNFIGARHLIEGLLPKMPEGSSISCIASGAGVGWQQELETYAPLHATTSFADAVKWCEENADVAFPMGGYRMSKVVVNQYVALGMHEVRRAGRAHQLPEPGSDGDADDAGVRGRRGQGHDRERARRDPPLLAARGAGVADGLPQQPTVQLRDR